MIQAQAEALRDVLAAKYPELVLVVNDDGARIRGSFPIVHDGEVLDRFLIELSMPPGFPAQVPTLREIGGRIPYVDDRHTNPNGESCPLVPEEWLILPIERRTLLSFLDGPVRSFLLFQALKDRGEQWPHGERSHGRRGLVEAYGEMVGMDGDAAVTKCLEYLASKKVKKHWVCPCGSGKRLQNCHLGRVRAAQERIPRKIARSALTRLRHMK